jgi:hypothetical protein
MLSLWSRVQVQVQVEVNLRRTVSPLVSLGVRLPFGAYDQIFVFCLSWFGAPSLTRGMVSNLLVQLLLGLARAVTLGSTFRRTHDDILLSHLRLPTWRVRSLYLYPPGTRLPSYTPGHWVPFCRLLRLVGLRWRYSNPASTRVMQSQSQSQSYITTDSQSVSMSWCRAQSGTLTRDLFFFWIYCPVFWGRPLWREVGSVLCQSFVNIV